MTTIQILDYGSGNLFSIRDSIERISRGKVRVVTSKNYLQGKVEGLILPGVGSFTSAQKVLFENRAKILEDLERGRIFLLGICLGMQLMFQKSKEGPGEGLSIFKGGVKRFNKARGIKIPHMGWNTIEVSKDSSQFCKGLTGEQWVYYVHSYYPVPLRKEVVKAWTEYGGEKFPALIEEGKVFGTQFHPEKSHSTGARLISNFVKLVQ